VEAATGFFFRCGRIVIVSEPFAVRSWVLFPNVKRTRPPQALNLEIAAQSCVDTVFQRPEAHDCCATNLPSFRASIYVVHVSAGHAVVGR